MRPISTRQLVRVVTVKFLLAGAVLGVFRPGSVVEGFAAASPVIECPADIVTDTDPSQNFATVAWQTANATDGSGQPISVNSNQASGNRFVIGSHTVSFNATDSNSTTKYCSFFITVKDAEPPVIHSCPSRINATTEPDEAYRAVLFTEPTATDNSGEVEISGLGRSGDRFPIGRTEVLYIAVDGALNAATCTLVVLVTDAERPKLTNCPDIFKLPVQQASDRAYADWSPPTATDNSGSVTLSTTLEPGQSLLPGQYSVTYTATDPAGLTVACPTFVINVQTSNGCVTSPCANGGVCTPVSNGGFTCTCTSSWSGATCEEEVCADGYCRNDGTCTPSSALYISSCTCASGYHGNRCESMVTGTDSPFSLEELSTEAILVIAAGGVIALLLVIILPMGIWLVRYRTVRARYRQRRRRRYSDASVNIVRSRTSSRTQQTMHSYPLEERDDTFSNQAYSQHYDAPYINSGRESRVILNPMRDRGDAYYY